MAKKPYTCNYCIELLGEVNEKPNCKACGKVKILKSNYEIFTIIEGYGSLFMDGMGGFSTDGIKYALDLEDIPLSKRKEYTKKITIYLTTYLKKSKEVNKLKKIK